MPRFINHLPKLIEDYKQKHPDMKQEDIARLADIHAGTLSRYINGHIGSVNLDIWEKLVKLFDVPGHEIFDFED
jgi:hypothetical protein